MTWESPFRTYSKDPLPRGQAYVLGRDPIEQALRGTGAEIGHLSLGRSHADPHEPRAMLLDMYWTGDGGTRVFGRQPDDDAWRLHMRWHAVSADVRKAIAAEVRDRWLPEASEWAAGAPTRGNVWRATDHRWLLWLEGGGLTVAIS